jgi:hypothetical protein
MNASFTEFKEMVVKATGSDGKLSQEKLYQALLAAGENTDAKPLAAALTNTLRLELVKTGFKETAGKVAGEAASYTETLVKLKTELDAVNRQAKVAIEDARKSAKDWSGITESFVVHAEKLRAVSLRTVFGSAVITSLVVVGVLALLLRSHYKARYEEDLAKAMQMVGTNRDAAIELTRLGKEISTGPVVNALRITTGRYLRVTGADNVTMKDADAIVYLKTEPEAIPQKTGGSSERN